MGLKGLFLKEETKDSKKVAKINQPLPASNQPLINSALPPTIAEGAPDDRFVKMLQDVIAENNIPGQDYFEFKQAIDAMASMTLDEKNKFLAAHIAGGFKKDVLAMSIDKYVSLIQNEQQKFAEDLAGQYDERVTKRLASIEQSKKDVEELNKRIVETNNLIFTATQEVQKEELNLRMTESSFKKSVERVISILNDDKQKITNYIQ